MTTVGLRELRQDASDLVRRVESGEEFEITVAGRLAARLVPAQPRRWRRWREIDENLNAPGSHFEPLAFETPCGLPDCAGEPDTVPNRFYAYGVVARLALLAAAIELQEIDPLNQ